MGIHGPSIGTSYHTVAMMVKFIDKRLFGYVLFDMVLDEP
jgi:hypothetical protein